MPGASADLTAPDPAPAAAAPPAAPPAEDLAAAAAAAPAPGAEATPEPEGAEPVVVEPRAPEPNTAAVEIVSDGNVELRSTAVDSVWASEEMLITASKDGRIRVWNMAQGILTTTFAPSDDADDPVAFLQLLPDSTPDHLNLLTLSKKSRQLKTWLLTSDNVVTLCRSVTVPDTGKGFVVNVPVPEIEEEPSSPTSVKLDEDDDHFAQDTQGIALDDANLEHAVSTGEEADAEVEDSDGVAFYGNDDSLPGSKNESAVIPSELATSSDPAHFDLDTRPPSTLQSGVIGDNEASAALV